MLRTSLYETCGERSRTMGWKKIKALTRSENFITVLFIACSLGAFVLASVFYFLFIVWAKPVVAPIANTPIDNGFVSPDPLITKIPGLKDVIKKPLINDIDPYYGSAKAPVQIVIFSDFTCQFCQQEEKIISDIFEAYANSVRVIRKDYPDGSESSPAWQAAIAGRCADEQDSFWLLNDELAKTKTINEDTIAAAAEKINLNQLYFKNCLAKDRTKQLIRDNIEEANTLDINGVPFIFVNDKEFMGETTFAELKTAVERELIDRLKLP